MSAFLIAMIVVLGVNTVLWTTVGLCRAVGSRFTRHRRWPNQGSRIGAGSVAVLIAAHNEELIIARTIRSARALVPHGNVFVVSDGSTDNTVKVAAKAGARVMDLSRNRGKAGALTVGIDHFALADSFDVVMLLDADTLLAADYLETGLPFFDDPSVVAVAGRATTLIEPAPRTHRGRFLVAYRERFYVVIQYLFKYGQAARPINVVSIVPGFASMYRARILGDIDIAAPGLAIEDFNMTFEVHAKRLGRIAFRPQAAIAYTQDPDTFADYRKQLHRWTLGFWQTVLRHGFHWGKFWGALGLYIVELVFSSTVILMLLPLFLVSCVGTLWASVTGSELAVAGQVAEAFPPAAVALGVLLPDYVLTIFTVCVTRRPRYLILGLGFPAMRVVDATLCLRSLAQALLSTNVPAAGTWKSPVRRPSATAVAGARRPL
ncbi:glycosyltransferase [Leifsonia sp. YAF41]|uniref:glycosyltransferase family 2 protein n=1 Tax=Leifsonia sp. YAF41 TaxID=3233086 RepID=UPI003F95E13D